MNLSSILTRPKRNHTRAAQAPMTWFCTSIHQCWCLLPSLPHVISKSPHIERAYLRNKLGPADVGLVLASRVPRNGQLTSSDLVYKYTLQASRGSSLLLLRTPSASRAPPLPTSTTAHAGQNACWHVAGRLEDLGAFVFNLCMYAS
jgi:hypothetical protein